MSRHFSRARSNTSARDIVRRQPLGRYLAALGLALIVSACGDAADPAELLARGTQLLADGDVASAIIELKNAVQAAPENAQARFVLGRAYIEAGDSAAALKELRRARSLGLGGDELNLAVTRALIASGEMDEAATELALNSRDGSAEWLTLQGLLDLAVGRYEEARTGFEGALVLDPNDVDARRAAIRTAIALGEPEAARAEVEAALKLTQDDYDIWILKGDLERHDKNYAAAIEAYDRALEVTPNSPLALLQRAAVRAADNDPDGAISDLDAIGEASNQDPRAVYLRALIARQRDQDNAALRYLRQILVTIPDHRQSLAQAAAIHFESNEYTQAGEYVDRLLALDPGNVEYQRMRGAIQLAAGRLEGGLDDIEGAELDDYTDPALLALLGTAYMRHGKIEQGTESLERAARLDPQSVPIRTQLAFSRMRAGKIDEAVAELEAIRRDDPDFMLAAVLQTFGYAALDKKERAFEIANELVGAHPDQPIAANLRGYLRAALGETDGARQDFESAIASDPAFFPAYFNLVRLSIKDDDIDGAKTMLEQVLDQSPNQPEALMYLAALKRRDGQNDEALALWLRAAENNADAIEPRVYLSRHYRRAGEIDQAMRFAEEAYRVGSYIPAAQFEFATLKLFSGDAEASMPAIDALVERFPTSAVPLELKARAQEVLGNIGSLRDTLEQLAEIAPDSPAPRVAMVRLLIKREEYDEAVKLAEALRADERFAAEGHDVLGDIHYARGDMSKAAAAYEKSHELKASSQSLLKLNAIKRRLGGGNAEMLDAWLSDNPDDTGVRVVKATADLEQGNTDTAIANYEKVLKSSPDNVIALNNLAWLYDERGDERSIEYARRAYELAPARPEIADTYGWILYRAGNLEQALKLIEKAAEADTRNPDIRFHLASVLAATGGKDRALKELESILSDEQEFPSRVEAETLQQSLSP